MLFVVCANSVTPPPPPGLLRLEELVQSFLISRETLSVRMLDDSLDPTPLLKEIRDDKVATVIIDANASVSYRILRKVRMAAGAGGPWRAPGGRRGLVTRPPSFFGPQAKDLGMMSAFYKYILTTMVRPAPLTPEQLRGRGGFDPGPGRG